MRHHGELLFRVVQVVKVDRVESEILAAAGDCIPKKRRLQGVAAAHDIVWSEDPGVEEFTLEIEPVLFARLWRTIRKREISALRADNDGLARRSTLQALLKCTTNAALRALTAIIDRGVDDVDAVL